jgi:uncharacterized protein YndB with AHSA1/START domain
VKLDLHYTEVLPHSLQRVWSALTTADALREWLMDSDFEPRVGREFTFLCPPSPGIRGYVECKVLELEPMRRVVWSWLATDEGDPTTVTIELEAVDGGTRLTLRHRGDVAREVRDRTAAGWTQKISELALYLARGHRRAELQREIP